MEDGWRYLGLKPVEVYELTPREFALILTAQQKRRYDEYEREATLAIMRESAHRAKRPKASDLFKRPKDDADERKLMKKAELAEHQAEWLAQFAIN
ncbi:phage tail assembly chaperone [Heyndrickxia sporothermodurans]|uniref:phage tail assembly chaperone n=1 Tax=Heyndrickxia sporothermodurans TaxID=46224 RepID=UPI00399CB99E